MPPHRVLRQSLEAAERFEGDIVGERFYPSEGKWRPVQRFQTGVVRKDKARGAIEAMPHWAGESVGGVKRVQPAAEIIEEMVSEAEALLRRWR